MSAATRRQDKPKDVWNYHGSAVRLGDERMRFFGLRPGLEDTQLDDVITSVQWDDVTMELTGQIEMTVEPGTLDLADGDAIRADFAPSASAAFNELWKMGLSGDANGEGITKGLAAASFTGALTSTLSSYRGDTMDFAFRRGKSHHGGWTCDQIAVAVGRKAGLPLGKIAGGTWQIRNLVRRDADPLDVIILAYRQERENTGRRFVAYWDGKLNIVPLRRSEYLLEILPVLLDGNYVTKRKADFATVLNVRTNAKSGKHKTRKIRVRVADHDAIKRYGVVTKSVHPHNIDTEDEAREWARRSLARRTVIHRELTVDVPFMPRVRRGDALRCRWDDEGLDQIVFVKSASHVWTPGSATTTLTVRFDDPFVPFNYKASQAKRSAAAARRSRKSEKGAIESARAATPKPKNAARRS